MPLIDDIALLLLAPPMDDLEKGTVQMDKEEVQGAEEEKDNPEHEVAAAKLWAVYISEAEKYDRGLVESWKSDMEGMLIFAGLFSASLTAFLIESYKTLNPDSGDTTVLLLAQISQQLAASVNGTTFPIPPPVPFTPPTSSLICNILWFISLGLSLTCALVATLLEQWARDFLHRADMRSAPVVRARVFSFLYFGLKRFKMHTVVEIIPLLLHASLFLFFVGLVAFLLPVNIAVTVIVGIIVGTVTVIYTLLTLLPLIHLDCPYRTPLSRGCWSLRQRVQTKFDRWHTRPTEPVSHAADGTMVAGIFQKAIERSRQRTSRDTQALVWTVKSLADDNELEPFIEAIGDVIWVPDTTSFGRRRYVYDKQMRHLMQDRNVQLFQRLRAFEDGCFSPLLTDELRSRRRICVHKAVWALGTLSAPGMPPFLPSSSEPGDRFNPPSGPRPTSQVLAYTISADAIVRWANMRAAQPLLDEALRRLVECRTELMGGNSKIPNLTLLDEGMSKLAQYHLHPPSRKLNDVTSVEVLLPAIDFAIGYIQGLPFYSFFFYISSAVTLEAIPHQFQSTRALIRPTSKIPRTAEFRRKTLEVLCTMMRTHRDLFQTEERLLWLDDEFERLVSNWEPEKTEAFPRVVLDYINDRHCDRAVRSLALSEGAWKALQQSISPEPSPEAEIGHRRSLTAIWRLFQMRRLGYFAAANPSVLEDIIQSISQGNIPLLTSSVLAMVKYHFFIALALAGRRSNILSNLNHVLLPGETDIPRPSIDDAEDKKSGQLSLLLTRRCAEGKLDTLSGYIECCSSGDLPYKAAETVASIGTQYIISDIHIDRSFQLRFATAVQEFLNTVGDSAEKDTLGRTILNLILFAAYAPTPKRFAVGPGGVRLDGVLFRLWLDDSDARLILKGALTTYLTRLSSTDEEDAELYSRIQTIVANLDTLHAQQSEGATDHSSESGRDNLRLGEEQA
ncbi:hypothetical protein DFH06DRAFT_142693 [Mycena polygramma]|nr:hypothetical protein DFH06DRAFT_142693 [Mycena polygramma]